MADDNKQAAKNAAKAAADLKKQKKKKWCTIVAPDMFQNRVIGETLLDDSSMLMNRTVTVNMMQLNNDMKRQHVNVMFKVVEVKEGKGLTQAVKFEISSSSLKRLAKREKDKRTDSFVIKTAVDKLVRIKPLMITNNMAKGSVLAALIQSCRAICKDRINKMPFDAAITALITGALQKDIRDNLHKTYPLRTFEIRMFELERKKRKETVGEVKESTVDEDEEIVDEETEQQEKVQADE